MPTLAPIRSHIVRHQSEQGWWEAVFAAPHPRVRSLVHGPFVGWTERTPSAMRRKEVPFPGIPLILNFGPPFRLLHVNGPPGSGVTRSSFVAGLHQQFALTEAPGFSYCLQVNLTPLGAYSVLGVPMHQLANRVEELESLLGVAAHRLIEQLAELPDWDSRFDLVDDFLGSRAESGRRASTATAWSWQELQRTGGLASIGQLARELQLSRRQLVARFREEVGLSPKLVGRIIRFNRAIAELKQNGPVRWSRIAHECGYHDQSHFHHDFREFTGASPSEYLGRMLPEGGGVAGD